MSNKQVAMTVTGVDVERLPDAPNGVYRFSLGIHIKSDRTPSEGQTIHSMASVWKDERWIIRLDEYRVLNTLGFNQDEIRQIQRAAIRACRDAIENPA